MQLIFFFVVVVIMKTNKRTDCDLKFVYSDNMYIYLILVRNVKRPFTKFCEFTHETKHCIKLQCTKKIYIRTFSLETSIVKC